jgi:SAM-dependent methyltransferase
MEAAEYERMARAEEGHWWYRGLRDALARSLGRLDPPLPPSPSVLDAGCGTGGTLRFLQDHLRPSYLAGFDRSEAALAFARRKAAGAELHRADLRDLDLDLPPLDLVVSLDVIYIPGIRASLEGLRRIAGRLRPGGVLALNLPAYEWLRAEHDLAVHTGERYRLREVRALIADLGLEPVRLTHRLFFLFPAVLLRRLPGMLRLRLGRGEARSDLLRLPGRPVNELLLRILGLENALIARGLRLPWGSSIFALARKP